MSAIEAAWWKLSKNTMTRTENQLRLRRTTDVVKLEGRKRFGGLRQNRHPKLSRYRCAYGGGPDSSRMGCGPMVMAPLTGVTFPARSRYRTNWRSGSGV